MKDEIHIDFDSLDYMIEHWPEGISDRAYRERHMCEYAVLCMTPDHFEIFREHRCTEVVGTTEDDLTTLKGEDGVTVSILASYFVRRLGPMVEVMETLKEQGPEGFIYLVAHKSLDN